MSDEGKKGLKNWAVLSGIAVQMGVIIGLGAFIGVTLDEKYPNRYSAFTIILSLAGVFISLYALIKQLQKLNKED